MKPKLNKIMIIISIAIFIFISIYLFLLSVPMMSATIYPCEKEVKELEVISSNELLKIERSFFGSYNLMPTGNLRENMIIRMKTSFIDIYLEEFPDRKDEFPNNQFVINLSNNGFGFPYFSVGKDWNYMEIYNEEGGLLLSVRYLMGECKFGSSYGTYFFAITFILIFLLILLWFRRSKSKKTKNETKIK